MRKLEFLLWGPSRHLNMSITEQDAVKPIGGMYSMTPRDDVRIQRLIKALSLR